MFFWALTKFSKDYTAPVQAFIMYENFPENTQIAPNNIEEIQLDISANGFEFLYYKFKKPVVKLNMSELEITGQKATIPKPELLEHLSAAIGKPVLRTNVPGNDLSIYLDRVVSKKVPVAPRAEINFKEGYGATTTVKITPNTVTVSGASEVIKTIDTVYTAQVRASGVEENLTTQVTVARPVPAAYTIMPATVKLQWEVSEFSQKQFTLPVVLQNVPEGVTIKIIPATITVTFNVPVAEFQKVTKADFEIVCNYAERNQESNFMVPQLTKKSTVVKNIELSENKIDYLIFK